MKEQRAHSLYRLSDARLLREQAYVNGRWTAADDLSVVEVRDPADGDLIGTVPDMGPRETRAAIEAAAEAFQSWRRTAPEERTKILRAWAAGMRAAAEDLAVLMVLEQGKPLKEAQGEIAYAASFLEWFAERTYEVGRTIERPAMPGRETRVRREPLGVVAAITPWNFPSAMITRKAAAALAAGCTVVVRPAELTPFSATALAELGERAGLPPGVFNVVTGMPHGMIGELTSNPTVRAISFTGSSEIGAKLLSWSAPTVKKACMELGGHAPFLVFEDADLEMAADLAVAAKFQTTGQDCLAVNRFLVHHAIYEPFLERFAEKAAALVVGPGLTPGVEQGPLMNARALTKVDGHVRDAVRRGARVMTGGGPHPLGGLFYQPTVLADAHRDMLIWYEETFGPAAAVMPFKDEAAAIAEANDSAYGLAAYVVTNDRDRADRVADALDCGMVGVNCASITGASIPFGGTKRSGLGREGGTVGLEEYTELKYVCSRS